MAKNPPVLIRNSYTLEEQKLVEMFRNAENRIINELKYKHSRGLVDYSLHASLERVRKTLRDLLNESEDVVYDFVNAQYYLGKEGAKAYRNLEKLNPEALAKKHERGYSSAVSFTITETAALEQLTQNIMGELVEAAMTAERAVVTMVEGAERAALLGRTTPDIFRNAQLEAVSIAEITGGGAREARNILTQELELKGVTGFVDKRGRNWSLSGYVDMAVRTTARQVTNYAVLNKNPEQDLYQISEHGATCSLCAPYEGRVYSRSGTSEFYPPLADAFGKIGEGLGNDIAGTYLNIHPNCLVPGGTILAEGVMAHSVRDYDGIIIRLVTSTGNEISVTPNHPVLTSNGFVNACELVEGDKIIEAVGGYTRFFRETPNNIEVPTLIEDIPSTFVKTCGSTTGRVKSSPVQFHGDGSTDGEVDIIFANRFIPSKIHTLAGKPISKICFPPTTGIRRSLIAIGTSGQIAISSHNPLDCLVSFGCFISAIKFIAVKSKELSDIRCRTAAQFRNLCKCITLSMQRKKIIKLFRTLGDIVRRNVKKLFSFHFKQPIVNHSPFNSMKCYSKLISDMAITDPIASERLQDFFRQNALVVSELVHIESSDYVGKVYNLETKYGFYSYNNIITHNCLHVLVPFREDLWEHNPEHLDEIRRFSNPETNPYNVDPRTEAQRKAYDAKERARARLYNDWKQYQRYEAANVEGLPKTFQTFANIKHPRIKSGETAEAFAKRKTRQEDKYKSLVSGYRARTKEITGGAPVPAI